MDFVQKNPVAMAMRTINEEIELFWKMQTNQLTIFKSVLDIGATATSKGAEAANISMHKQGEEEQTIGTFTCSGAIAQFAPMVAGAVQESSLVKENTAIKQTLGNAHTLNIALSKPTQINGAAADPVPAGREPAPTRTPEAEAILKGGDEAMKCKPEEFSKKLDALVKNLQPHDTEDPDLAKAKVQEKIRTLQSEADALDGKIKYYQQVAPQAGMATQNMLSGIGQTLAAECKFEAADAERTKVVCQALTEVIKGLQDAALNNANAAPQSQSTVFQLEQTLADTNSKR